MNIGKKRADIIKFNRKISYSQLDTNIVSNKNKKIIVFDNDECTGQYSFLGYLHSIFIEDSNLTYPNTKKSYTDVVKLISKYYLSYGGIRPYVKKTFQYLHNKKKRNKVDKIFMYTAAENIDNYVIFLKDCLEYHCDCIGLFDNVYDRSYCNNDLSKDLKKISNLDTSTIIMFDDRPNNINKYNGFVYGVEPYLYQPKWNNIQSLINEFDKNYLDELYRLNNDYFNDLEIDNLIDWLEYQWHDCQYTITKKEDKNFSIVQDILQALIK